MTEIISEQSSTSVDTSPVVSAEGVINRYYTDLEPLLRRTINHRYPGLDGADVTQEVAIALFGAVNNGSIRFEAAIPNWVFIVALRTAKRMHKNLGTNVELPAEGIDVLPKVLIETNATPESYLAQRVRNDALQTALNGLTTREADVLTSIFIHNVDYQEIASRWEVSVESIGPIRTRSLRRAKRLLTQNGYEARDVL